MIRTRVWTDRLFRTGLIGSYATLRLLAIAGFLERGAPYPEPQQFHARGSD
jgi:hypothetical protein